jgi:hypothetical protein
MSKNRQHKSANTPKNKNKPAVGVLIAEYGLLGTIVTAVLGCAGISIAAYLSYMGIKAQIERPAMFTQTAEARSTALAQSFTATFTLTPTPSATPTVPYPANTVLQTSTAPLPTETATPTLFPTETPTPTSVSITQMPFETFFQECRSHTFTSENGLINISPACSDADIEGQPAIQLSWVIPNTNSYAGCTIALESLQTAARTNKALVFWARGAYDNEPIAIKLKDAAGEKEKLINLTTGWQQVILPLWYFPDIDAGQLKELTIGIAYDRAAMARNGKGSACISAIGFGSP